MAKKLNLGQFLGPKLRFLTMSRFSGSKTLPRWPISTRKPADESSESGLSFETQQAKIWTDAWVSELEYRRKRKNTKFSNLRFFSDFASFSVSTVHFFFQIMILRIEEPLGGSGGPPVSEPQGAMSPQSWKSHKSGDFNSQIKVVRWAKTVDAIMSSVRK